MNFSEEEFNKKALELFNISEVLNDNWKINEKDQKFYLSKTKTLSVKSKSSQRPPADLLDDNDDDPSVAMVKMRDSLILIEYHVLFHPSYQVPVLYFNAHSGEPNANKKLCKLIALRSALRFRRLINLAKPRIRHFCGGL